MERREIVPINDARFYHFNSHCCHGYHVLSKTARKFKKTVLLNIEIYWDLNFLPTETNKGKNKENAL